MGDKRKDCIVLEPHMGFDDPHMEEVVAVDTVVDIVDGVGAGVGVVSVFAVVVGFVSRNPEYCLKIDFVRNYVG